MKKAIFAGSFDPFTIGHYNIVTRGLTLFEEIIIAIGVNGTKKSMFSVEKRVNLIKEAFKGEKRIKVMTYKGLTTDFAHVQQANFLLRGVRGTADLEYEQTVAEVNKRLTDIETILLFTDSQYGYISSTVVRDLINHGKDVSAMLPPNVRLD
jgi:pantetheine-phosphate adenylyltransferase